VQIYLLVQISRVTAAAIVAFGAADIRAARAQDVITPAPEVVYFANVTAAPFKWIGRLTIPNPAKGQGWLSVCTAQFITPNVILTAGHCLGDLSEYPTGPFGDPSQGQFQLQYNSGSVTQTFKIVCGLSSPLYSLPSNYTSLPAAQQQAAQAAAHPHDFAMLLVNGTSSAGVMPYALDWKGKYSFVWRIGYPADVIGGDLMIYTPGIVFSADTIPLPSPYNLSNLVVQWGPMTDATEGMSGGAWAAPITDNKGNITSFVMIAVTSFSVDLKTDNTTSEAPAYPGAAWAAYLTAAEFNPLLQKVQNGCK
jgi:V8-like Glu-specific endopeptidase